MKTVFICWAPHPLHKKWASTITSEHYSFIPRPLINKFRASNPVIHQLLALFTAWRIPKADVYLLEGITCLLPAIMRKKKYSKIIMLNADSFFDDLTNMKGIKRKIFMFYLKHIDGIISNSDYSKALAKRHVQIPQKVVYPGIDNKYFKINANIKSKNIAHGLSTLRKQKGTDLVIEAFKRMKNKDKLYLIGPVDDVTVPKQDNIIVTGWTEHPEEYLKKCGVYVNPARFESFGMNIVEAMAAGFAPIVSDKCGAKDIVKKLSDRLIIKPGVENIIKSINWLNEKNRKVELGKKAKIIAKEHTIDNSIKNFKKTFIELVNEIKHEKS